MSLNNNNQQDIMLMTYHTLISQVLDQVSVLVVVFDHQGKISHINKTCQELVDYAFPEILGNIFWEVFICSEERNAIKQILKKKGKEFFPYKYTGLLPLKNDHSRLIAWNFSTINDEAANKADLVVATGIDITESSRLAEELRYMSMHDAITGLYNRTYFEEEMRRLEYSREKPIGIIVIDLDGLKLVNNTIGHEAGDTILKATANILKQTLRESDMVARIGGDEFAILLPGTNADTIAAICQRIEEAVALYNQNQQVWPLSISIGFAVRKDGQTSLRTLFKRADKNMYQIKLQRCSNARSSIMETLNKMLQLKDFLAESQIKRLENLVVEIAQVVGLTETSISYLRLLAHYHDVGKVAFSEQLLFKPGPLTPEEYDKIKEHCEVGYRIAWSAPDIAPIAELILKHHERWDGKGYPLGLKWDEIPLECRILAIADAYDSMTSERPYRNPLSHAEAVAELKRCAGTQFDPNLVPVVVEILEKIVKPSAL